MKFTYRWGQRPLDGYTIKRGLGHGGFGEVYFALSDGGKEVALKLIRGHGDIELRGIGNCLNLKHPHLVHLYDLRTDSQGDRWLVMEYVQGESLGNILQRSPRGLAESQAREWFLEAARAVNFLHDHAVVHRDIKPANIFIENGRIKLGDYGLSKSVGASQHEQSSNVGTIHYMAPEVASGAYSKQIDIYACGVMLFEMLTGEVPFKGESWAEIAIKHQTDLPNMRYVPTAYIPILEKALNKKADRRFADMNEMIQAVEMIEQPTTETAQQTPTSRGEPQPSAKPQAALRKRGQISELTSSLLLAPLPAIPATAIWAIFTGSVNWGVLASLFLIMVAVAWTVLITAKMGEGSDNRKPQRFVLILFGAGIGLMAFWLEGWSLPELWLRDESIPAGLQSYWGGVLRAERGAMEILSAYSVFFMLALGVPRWWMSADRKRKDRFSLYPLIASGAWGLILLAMWQGSRGPNDAMPPGEFVLALAGAAAIVQMVSHWSPPAPVNKRYRRRWAGDARERGGRI